MRLVGSDIPAAVFAELDDGVRDEVVEYIDIDTLVATVQELDSDDAVFVLEDLDTQEQQEVLQKISASDRARWSAHWNFPKTVPDVWRRPNLSLCRRSGRSGRRLTICGRMKIYRPFSGNFCR